MRLLHIVHNFPPEFEGGTERYLAGLVRLQRKAGLEVAVLTGSDVRSEQDVAREDWFGVEVRRVFRTGGEDFGVKFAHPRVLEVLQHEVRALAPELIHLHHWFNLADPILVGLPGIPAVASFHDAYAACPRIFMMRPDGFFCGSDLPVPLERCAECVRPDDSEADVEGRLEQRQAVFAAELARVDRALFPSQFHRDVMVGTGLVPAAKSQVLPLGLEDFPEPEPFSEEPGRLRLACFGHLSLLKGVDLLLKAVAALAERDSVELHLFGRILPDEEPEVRRLAEGLTVHFHGPYGRHELARAAGSLDLAVFPSRAHETYSLVLEEAVALRLPVVVSDRGALPERARGFGAVVPVEDEAALAECLAGFLADPGRLRELRRQLPPRPARLADHERALHALYGEVLGGD